MFAVLEYTSVSLRSRSPSSTVILLKTHIPIRTTAPTTISDSELKEITQNAFNRIETAVLLIQRTRVV